jgi:hypothetical protein
MSLFTNAPTTAIETAGWAQVALVDANTFNVRTRNDAGTLVDGNFHVAVLC